MRLERLCHLFLVSLIVFSLSCTKQPGEIEFIAIERIPSSHRDEQLAKFSSYPIDRQIDIYLFAQLNLAGKRDTYLRYLADNGETKVEDIVRRIDSSDRFSFKTDLIRALDFIDEKCSCVRDNSNVLQTLSKNQTEVVETDLPDIRMSKDLYRKVLERIKSRTS